MDVEVTRRHGAQIVTLSGVVDLATSPAMRTALLDAVRRAVRGAVRGRAAVIVDLSRLDHMDSSGVASLIEGYQAAQRATVRFALAGVGPATQRMLALARLDTIFTVHSDVDSALAAEG